MKRTFFFKSLLLAAMLAVGGSAWSETVGDANLTTAYLGANSTIKTMASGTTLHYVFTQTKAKDGNFKGWLLWVGANGATVNWDNGISIVRGDNWDDKWPLGTDPETYGANTGCTSNFDWDNFNTDMNGATIDMTLTYTLGSFTMASTITNGDKSYSYSYAKTIPNAPTFIDVCLSVNEAYLDITTTEFVTPSITSIPCTYDFTAANALIAPFDNGSIRTGTNVQALTVTNQIATAWFDSNDQTNGNQAYEISSNEKVTVTLNNYHGWLSGGKTTTVTIWAPEGKSLASYTYNASATKITDVKIGGTTPEGFVEFANNHLNGLAANGRSPFANDGKNPVITISISGSKYVEMSFVRDGKTDASYSGTLGNDITTALEKITVVDGSSNADRAYHIGSLAITTETISEATVTYVFEDTDGNSLASIKANQTAPGSVGETIEDVIPASFKNTFYNGDESVKYVYSTFSCSDATVPAGGTTVTLKFDALTKFTYNVKAVDGNNNELATIASTSGFAGDTKELFWSKYIKVDNQWYVADAPFYQGSITENGEKRVTYTLSNIAYFIECENMNGVRTDRWVLETNANNSGYRKIRINNYMTTLYTDIFAEGGVYDLALPYNNGNSTNSTYQIRTRTANGTFTDVAEWTCENGAHTYTLNNIVIPAGSSLAISCDGISGNSNARMDYLTLTQSKASATLGANGYTTFASPYALDLTGVTAYKAAVEGNVVRFTELKQTVPANTGFLLEGTAGATVTIPVVADGTEVSGNAFLVNTAGTTFDAESGYTYYGLIKNSNPLTFGTFAPGTVAIPADKAYLMVANAQAARLVAVFGDESTGINAVNGEGFTGNGSVYNLSGQRVAQPSKGLYIVNGKKVLVK